MKKLIISVVQTKSISDSAVVFVFTSISWAATIGIMHY